MEKYYLAIKCFLYIMPLDALVISQSMNGQFPQPPPEIILIVHLILSFCTHTFTEVTYVISTLFTRKIV